MSYRIKFIAFIDEDAHCPGRIVQCKGRNCFLFDGSSDAYKKI